MKMGTGKDSKQKRAQGWHSYRVIIYPYKALHGITDLMDIQVFLIVGVPKRRDEFHYFITAEGSVECGY